MAKELDSDDDVTECKRVVRAAAKLIRAEIREFDYSCVNYPLENDICDPEADGKFILPLLKALMHILVNNNCKELAISNAVLSASRPRSVIAPVMIFLGVQMYHAYGSKWLIDELAIFGFYVI